jgi:hypothetical protein
MLKYYEYAEQNGGLPVKMRLAMKTGVPSEKAESAPDSPDVLNKFHAAAVEVIGPGVPQF